MSVRTGALQFLTWDASGGSTPKAPGLLVGGEVSAESGVDIRYGVGGQSSSFAGSARFSGRAEIELTKDTKAFVLNALRVSGVLPSVKLIGGTDEVDFTHDAAYINRLVLSGAIDEPMKAVVEWISPTEVEGVAGGAMVALGSALLPQGGAAVTVGLSPYVCQSWEITVENGIAPYYSLDAKDAGELRLPVGLSLGMEKITARISSALEQTWEPGEDVPDADIGAVVLYTDGTNSITCTLTGLTRRGARPMPLVTESGLVIWPYEFLGQAGSLAIT